MLSRVADSLYWIGRYMERSDGILRMLKINYASSQDDLTDFSWRPVLKIFTYLEEEEAVEIADDSRAVLKCMVTDKENPNSVYNIVTLARENARSVQDHITKELWQCLNDFYHIMRQAQLSEYLDKEDPITVLDGLIQQCLLFYGTLDITMARGDGYSYLNIGKCLERAIQTAEILDVKFSSLAGATEKPMDTTYWKYLLLSLSGFQLYLKTYRSGFEARNVVEQVILNDQFPRSVIYSINQMHRYFERFKAEHNPESFNSISFLMGRIKSKVQYSTAESIIQQGLHQYLRETIEELNTIGLALSDNYFSYA